MADPREWGAVPVSTPEDWGAVKVDKPSSTADFFKSIPRGVVGGVGAGVEGFPNVAVPALGPLSKISELMGGPSLTGGLPGKEKVRKAIEGVTGEFHKPETRAGRFGETVGEFAGNPLGYAGPGGVAGKVIGNVSAAVGSEAAGQAFAGGKGEQAARLVGGVAGGSFPSLLRMLNPSVVAPERQRALDVLKQDGIKPTVGQVTGSEAMRRAEGTLGTAVGAGGAGRREVDRISDEFTAAVNRRMGAKATRATPEVIEETRDRLGDAFERTARDLKIRADQKYVDDISAWAQDLMKEALPNETTNRLIQQARNLAQGFLAGKPGEAAVMPGKNYQAHTRHDTPLARAIDDPDPNVGYYATRLRSILDDALERTATGRGTQEGKGMKKALAELKEARRQWYNMLVISRAVSGPGEGAAAGHISPQKLRQMLTSSDDRKIQYAAGRGDLSELSHAANEILAPIPTSQTAERALTTSIPLGLGLGAMKLAEGDLAGAAGLAGGPFLPGLAGRALLSKPVQSTKRGDWQPEWLKDALNALPDAKSQTLRSLLLSQGQRGLPGYQEGGVSSGGLAVVGERGPEIVDLPPDAEVIPNHDIDSLLRQMGSGPAPPAAEPMTRALPGYEQRSPGELAMIRTQEATRPTRGRADITPEHAAQMLLAAGGMYAAPESLVARGAAAAPKTMTALLSTLGLTAATEAGTSEPDLSTAEGIKEFQREAKKQGIYLGNIDGQLGPQTIEAKKAFDAAKAKAAEDARKERELKLKESEIEAKKGETALGEKKLEERKSGQEELRTVEEKLPTWRRILRNYGPQVGYLAGVLAGGGLKSMAVRSSNKAVREAESLIKPGAPIEERVAGVNEFWRKGGAGADVPFTQSPRAKAGFTAKKNPANLADTYPPLSRTQRWGTDAGFVGAFGAEAGAGHFMKPSEDQMATAYKAVSDDPSSSNIERLQALKDQDAFADLLFNMGRTGAGAYLGHGLLERRQLRPSMQGAEAERFRIEDYLRSTRAPPKKPATQKKNQTDPEAFKRSIESEAIPVSKDTSLQWNKQQDWLDILRGGKPIGRVIVTAEGKSLRLGPKVDEDLRRQGIATDVYDTLRKLGERHGMKLEPSFNLSRSSFEMWKKRDPVALRRAYAKAPKGSSTADFLTDAQRAWLRGGAE